MNQEKTEMSKIEEMFRHISNNMQAMDDKLTAVVQELKSMKTENTMLKRVVEKQEEKIVSLEREIRRRNLIIKGVDEGEDEEIEETRERTVRVIQSIGVKISPEADIDEIRRMGRPKEGSIRPIILKLRTAIKKTEIMRKTSGLRGTNIWIDEDYTKEIQEERRILIPKLKEARKMGHKAQLKHNKLIINDKVFDSESIQAAELGESKQSKDKKRKTNMRSPESDKLEEQLSKITRTSKTIGSN